MASVSSLPGPALQASKAALNAALAENKLKEHENDTLEPGEIQEVDMQTQADNIRTVFNDASNFNVKVDVSFVCCMHRALTACVPAAPAVLTLDALVRLADDKGPQPSPDACNRVSADAASADPWWDRSTGLDGGHQTCDQLR